MKNFLKQIGVFISIIVFFVIIVISVTKYFALKCFPMKLENVNTLILGDSHTQCGIDDTVIPNSLNLSESADTYFYSYVKLKRLLEKNKQIDTVILAYANFNITDNQDRWLKSENLNGFKLPLYFFMFDQNDFRDFMIINPRQYLKFSGTIFKRNFSHLMRILKKENINKFGIGGFLALDKKMDKKKELINNKNITTDWKNSETDIVYLRKIYDLCTHDNIKLILLSTPTYEKDFSSKNNKNHITYYNKYLKEADYLDFSLYHLKHDEFADNSHLNRKGAINFTEYLSQKVLNSSSQK